MCFLGGISNTDNKQYQVLTTKRVSYTVPWPGIFPGTSILVLVNRPRENPFHARDFKHGRIFAGKIAGTGTSTLVHNNSEVI